jgi:hypothetical protein
MKINFTFQKVNTNEQMQYEFSLLGGIIKKSVRIDALRIEETKDQSQTAKAKTLSFAEISSIYKSYKQCKQSTRGYEQWLEFTLKSIKIERMNWQTMFGLFTVPLTAVSTGLIWTLKSMFVVWLYLHTTVEEGDHIMVKVAPAYQSNGFATYIDLFITVHPMKLINIWFRFIYLMIRNPSSVFKWMQLFRKFKKFVNNKKTPV